ncbi:hypothetical protein Natpe_0934 [Natrinema pellirubrum DSM 15624]|uniref:Uncharacterized protein n=2 Tax=Natrinema pellirubrum (strain DSM 15624 / CIP 106293 / JCM 10476 / NCIMB 786 / 157) TaxID=797303 RepID=L0JJ39_NATP1|nr:hypothetical protein Natpe_0934 [Natrinema pellirubrum DSM 15624]
MNVSVPPKDAENGLLRPETDRSGTERNTLTPPTGTVTDAFPMSTRRSPSLVDLFRAAPAKSSLLTIAPLALALGQLWNGYVNGVSPIVSVGFAVVMVAFSVVAMGHHAAEHRLRRLEAEP